MGETPEGSARAGAYLGTEVDGAWWRRYRRSGFFARGNGEFWYDGGGFHFRRYLTRRATTVPFEHVVDIEIGSRHAGRWCAGAPILKLVWECDDHRLSSGFVVSRHRDETEALAAELRSAAGLPRR